MPLFTVQLAERVSPIRSAVEVPGRLTEPSQGVRGAYAYGGGTVLKVEAPDEPAARRIGALCGTVQYVVW